MLFSFSARIARQLKQTVSIKIAQFLEAEAVKKEDNLSGIFRIPAGGLQMMARRLAPTNCPQIDWEEFARVAGWADASSTRTTFHSGICQDPKTLLKGASCSHPAAKPRWYSWDR